MRVSRTNLDYLVDGYSINEIRLDRKVYRIETEGPTYLERRFAAFDSGNPDGLLDLIELDRWISKISDLPVRAAMLLRLAGLEPESIGSIVKDRKRRSGRKLIEDGVRMVRRMERDHYEAWRESL